MTPNLEPLIHWTIALSSRWWLSSWMTKFGYPKELNGSPEDHQKITRNCDENSITFNVLQSAWKLELLPQIHLLDLNLPGIMAIGSASASRTGLRQPPAMMSYGKVPQFLSQMHEIIGGLDSCSNMDSRHSCKFIWVSCGQVQNLSLMVGPARVFAWNISVPVRPSGWFTPWSGHYEVHHQRFHAFVSHYPLVNVYSLLLKPRPSRNSELSRFPIEMMDLSSSLCSIIRGYTVVSQNGSSWHGIGVGLELFQKAPI